MWIVFKIWLILAKSSSMCKICLKYKVDSRLSLPQWLCHLHLKVFSWLAGEEWHHSKRPRTPSNQRPLLSVPQSLIEVDPGECGAWCTSFFVLGRQKRGGPLWKMNWTHKYRVVKGSSDAWLRIGKRKKKHTHKTPKNK